MCEYRSVITFLEMEDGVRTVFVDCHTIQEPLISILSEPDRPLPS
jgi:hypothetical protein